MLPPPPPRDLFFFSFFLGGGGGEIKIPAPSVYLQVWNEEH